MKAIFKALASVRLFSVKDMVWQYAANFGVAIFGALYILILGRLLGPGEFGVYALAAAVPTVVNALFDYRIQEISIVVLHEQADGDQKRRDISDLFFFDVGSRLVSFIVSVVVGMVLLRMVGASTDVMLPIFAALAVLMTKSGSGMAMGVLRLSGNIQKYAVFQSMDWATRLSTIAILYYAGALTVEHAFMLQMAPALLFNVLIIVSALRICRLRYDYRLDTTKIIANVVRFFSMRKKILLSSQSISAVDSVVKELDTIICSLFLSIQSVAIYKMAKSIAGISWKLVDPIFVIILPEISSYISSGKSRELDEILKKATFYLFAAAVVVFLIGWVGAFLATYIFLGSAYAEVPMVYPLISLWIVVALPFIWTHSLSIASGNASLQAVAGAVGNFIGLIAIVAGAALAGLNGAALGLSVAFAGPFILSFIFLRRRKIVQWR